MTLTEARSAIHTLVTPDGVNAAVVLESINWMQQRFINSGLWRGSKQEIVFTSPSGHLTLPRRFESILGARFDAVPKLTYSQYHTFISSGPGEVSDDEFTMDALIDLGTGFPSYNDISATATLRVKIEDATDAGGTVWLKGEDANGRVIHNATGVEGVSLTTVSPSADTTQTFSKLTGFQKSVSEGYFTLWQVVGGVETQIGTYEPGETIADLHRYKIGNHTDSSPDTITVLAKRKYIPAANASDLVYPDNIAALKFGAMSYNYLVQNDLERSDAYWQRALGELNFQTKQSKGAAQQRQLVSPHGLQLSRITRMR